MTVKEVAGKYRHYDLVLGTESDGSTWCHVSIKVDRKEYCNSLTFIEWNGGIEVGGEIREINERDQQGIRNWAENNDY
jgi:hypothetical protein